MPGGEEELIDALAARGRSLAPADRAPLLVAIERALARAHAAYPELSVDRRHFLTYLVERLPPADAPAAGLAAVDVPDLYLAHACLQGDPRAVAHLEATLVSQVPVYVARYTSAPAQVDEVKQTLRIRLLIGGASGGPQLASYSGRGPLGAWLRVVAVRIGLDLLRANSAAPLDQLQLPDATFDDAELALLKARYAPTFQRALDAALETLEVRERTMLRLHFVDGMTLSAIARSFNVNPSTVHRAIGRTRDRVLEQTLIELGQELGVNDTQALSIMRLVQSRLDLDLQRCLETRPVSG